MKIKTSTITRTGILMALTVIFQYVGRFIPLGPNSNFVVGPLVNACLLISVASAGLLGGTVISFVAPLFAVLTTNSPAAPFILVFSPFIAVGNFTLVLVFYLAIKKYRNSGDIDNKINLTNIYGGISLGALLKFLVLYGGVNLMLGMKEMATPIHKMMIFVFGWPQLVTALVGGIYAVIVIKIIGTRIFYDSSY